MDRIESIESGAASFLIGNDSLAAVVDKLLLDVYTDDVGDDDEESDDLYIEGCDDEQIYQQLEVLHNNQILEDAEGYTEDIFEPSDNEDEDEKSEDGLPADDDREEEVNEVDEDDFAEGEDSDLDEEENEGLEDIEDDEDFDEDEVEKKLSKQASKIYGKTEIDDKFFSLREMEEICEEQEQNEEVDLDEEMLDELYGDGGDDGKDLFGESSRLTFIDLLMAPDNLI